MMFANIFIWIGLGLVAGLAVSFLFPHRKKYMAGTVTAGIVGAFAGGIVLSVAELGRIAAEIDPYATIGSVLGAAALIYFIHLLVNAEEKEKKAAI